MTKLAAILAVLAASLALAASAAAQPYSNPVSAATRRAAAYWGQTPCNGNIGIEIGAEPGIHEGMTVMWSTFNLPIGVSVNSPSVAPDEHTDCVVHLNEELWPTWQEDDLSFGEFCQAMVYEFGHFMGHPDEGTHPGEAFYDGPTVPQCRTWKLYNSGTIYTQNGQVGLSNRER